MHAPVLATKLYVPPLRRNGVVRRRLLERLDEGRGRKLTLISAPAGFGKTALVSSWAASCGRDVAWLSLDDEHNDVVRFLAYFVAALQRVNADIGQNVLSLLNSPQPPPVDLFLTILLNELTEAKELALVLDDYQAIAAKQVEDALGLLLEHLPSQVQLIVATREEPSLPLARLRARDELTELHAADLRFTPTEAAEFLNTSMGLGLTTAEVAALEDRTEGWIAGLQLAAVSLRGHTDSAGFIQSFTGGHRFVLDYLVEEVFQRQPGTVQQFLLRTSILDRLCGPLCDAVLQASSSSGQETLEYLEDRNLFVVPLDNERKWFRYHHLFRDLLCQRLEQSSDLLIGEDGGGLVELNSRAGNWYEENGFEIEAFHHAAAAGDLDRAERLIEGRGMPLYFRGAGGPILKWLESLPATELDARPSLWVALLSMLTFSGRPLNRVAEKLDAAEASLRGAEQDERIRNLLGHIAALRAMLAIPHSETETIIDQSREALEQLHPDNLPIRTAAIWTMGFGSQLRGDLAAAKEWYLRAISLGEESGNAMAVIAACTSLGQLQEAENELQSAAESYRRVIQLAGDPPLPASCEAQLGMARVLYEWNDLAAAEAHAEECAKLAPQLESVGTPATCAAFLARLSLARGDLPGAAAFLDEADDFVHRNGFEHLRREVAATRILLLLGSGDSVAARRLAHSFDLPISQARVHLARGDTSAAVELLESLRREAEACGSGADLLEATVLEALACFRDESKAEATALLAQAISLAESAGFVRTFVDEGEAMARLLSDKASREIAPHYVGKLIAALRAEKADEKFGADRRVDAPANFALYEPLSEIELKVLSLVAEGLSNQEIGERLHRALSTIKGHNRTIFAKLQVERRTEAVARARELGLL